MYKYQGCCAATTTEIFLNDEVSNCVGKFIDMEFGN